MTSPLHVFRVEHSKDHKGPYCGRSDGDGTILHGTALGLQAMSTDEHPLPRYEDGGVEVYRIEADHRLHGFQSMDQLQRWFTMNQRKWMRQAGYEVVVYTAPESYVLDLPRQTVFDHRHANRCTDFPALEL